VDVQVGGAKERKTRVEESRISLVRKGYKMSKKAKEHALLFMDPNTMDATRRIY
jgi:hypothetical protein